MEAALVETLRGLRDRLKRARAAFADRHLSRCIFIHINKTAGRSIEAALGLPSRHRTAQEMLAVVGERRWAQRFSFGFVRNPWDKVVSHYHYRVSTDQTGLGEGEVSFVEWVRLAYGERDPRYYDHPRMFMPQVDWLADPQGRIMVDFVGRFERLHDDFGVVCERLGVDATLPHRKKGTHRPYAELYDEATTAIVARHFAADIEAFGYAFAS